MYSSIQKPRPKSPHMQIYRWTITMAMSIAHRLTGVALYFGTIFMAIWLICLSLGEEFYTPLHSVYSSWFGQIILFLYSFALLHHMYGGIRHFFWDVKPELLQKDKASKAATITLIASILSTLLIWVLAYSLH